MAVRSYILSSSRTINGLLFIVVSIAAAGVAWLYFGERAELNVEASVSEPVTVLAQRTRPQPLADRIQALGTARANQAVEITPEISGVIDTLLELERTYACVFLLGNHESMLLDFLGWTD